MSAFKITADRSGLFWEERSKQRVRAVLVTKSMLIVVKHVSNSFRSESVVSDTKMLRFRPETRCFALLNLKIDAGFFSTTSYNLPQITTFHLIYHNT